MKSRKYNAHSGFNKHTNLNRRTDGGSEHDDDSGQSHRCAALFDWRYDQYGFEHEQ